MFVAVWFFVGVGVGVREIQVPTKLRYALSGLLTDYLSTVLMNFLPRLKLLNNNCIKLLDLGHCGPKSHRAGGIQINTVHSILCIYSIHSLHLDVTVDTRA